MTSYRVILFHGYLSTQSRTSSNELQTGLLFDRRHHSLFKLLHLLAWLLRTAYFFISALMALCDLITTYCLRRRIMLYLAGFAYC